MKKITSYTPLHILGFGAIGQTATTQFREDGLSLNIAAYDTWPGLAGKIEQENPLHVTYMQPTEVNGTQHDTQSSKLSLTLGGARRVLGQERSAVLEGNLRQALRYHDASHAERNVTVTNPMDEVLAAISLIMDNPNASIGINLDSQRFNNSLAHWCTVLTDETVQFESETSEGTRVPGTYVLGGHSPDKMQLMGSSIIAQPKGKEETSLAVILGYDGDTDTLDGTISKAWLELKQEAAGTDLIDLMDTYKTADDNPMSPQSIKHRLLPFIQKKVILNGDCLSTLKIEAGELVEYRAIKDESGKVTDKTYSEAIVSDENLLESLGGDKYAVSINTGTYREATTQLEETKDKTGIRCHIVLDVLEGGAIQIANDGRSAFKEPATIAHTLGKAILDRDTETVYTASIYHAETKTYGYEVFTFSEDGIPNPPIILSMTDQEGTRNAEVKAKLEASQTAAKATAKRLAHEMNIRIKYPER